MGLIHIYTGDGKGKTTAACGLICRQLGYGNQVVLIQFLKGGTSGEALFLSQMGNCKVIRQQEVKKFVFQMDEMEKLQEAEICQALWSQACEAVEHADLVVLDEVFGALSCGLLELDETLQLAELLPERCELVLTGRDAPEEWRRRADYVTEMREVKHPMQRGILARQGIEY